MSGKQVFDTIPRGLGMETLMETLTGCCFSLSISTKETNGDMLRRTWRGLGSRGSDVRDSRRDAECWKPLMQVLELLWVVVLLLSCPLCLFYRRCCVRVHGLLYSGVVTLMGGCHVIVLSVVSLPSVPTRRSLWPFCSLPLMQVLGLSWAAVLMVLILLSCSRHPSPRRCRVRVYDISLLFAGGEDSYRGLIRGVLVCCGMASERRRGRVQVGDIHLFAQCSIQCASKKIRVESKSA